MACLKEKSIGLIVVLSLKTRVAGPAGRARSSMIGGRLDA